MKSLLLTLSFAIVLLIAAFANAIKVNAPGSLRQTGAGWPPCAPGQKQISGYFDINVTTQKNYFYWMIESKQANSNKLILWLTGGPGCASTLALVTENGPCHFHESTGELYLNPYAWTNEANVIWLDQPGNVGFSTVSSAGNDRNEAEVGHDNNAFMQHFLAANPHMAEHLEQHHDENYEYHATASYIFNANKNGTNAIKVNLKGLATGNGLVAPVVQYPEYVKMATIGCEQERPDKQPCVSSFAAYLMNASIPSCVDACKSCDAGNALDCDFGVETCNSGQLAPYEDTGLNVYDVTQPCEYPPLCYNFNAVTTFFNRADVKASLGANPSVNWQTCSDSVNQRFIGDWLHRFDLLIPPMLEAGIRYLNYAGDHDFICNWMGNQAVALNLPWSGKAAFNAAPFRSWIVNGQEIAQVRSVASQDSPIIMNFFRVINGTHLVPMSQPKTASLMINAFINNRPFL